jgi:hypothetical protein
MLLTNKRELALGLLDTLKAKSGMTQMKTNGDTYNVY